MQSCIFLKYIQKGLKPARHLLQVLVKGYVLFVWGSINLRSQQWNGLAVHCKFQRKENTNHELWLKFLGGEGGAIIQFQKSRLFFYLKPIYYYKGFQQFWGGHVMGGSTPAIKEKRRNCKNRNESAKKKIKIFIFSHFIFFI